LTLFTCFREKKLEESSQQMHGNHKWEQHVANLLFGDNGFFHPLAAAAEPTLQMGTFIITAMGACLA
jgi:hypothetical protein